jgi:hypothetical protein
MDNKYQPKSGVVSITFLLAVLTLGMGGCDQTARQISIETILDNNLAAVRDDAQIGSVSTTEKIVEISESNYTLSARYRASSAGTMRIDVFAEDTRVYSEGKDADGVWEWPGGKEGPENVYHEGIGALEHGIEFNLFALAELQNRGHAIELVDQETIRDIDYYVLKVTLSDGFENYRYVNSKTWLVDLSRDFRALHPAIDPTMKNVETRYDNWTSTDGITHADRSRDFDMASGELVQTGIVSRSSYNVPDDKLDIQRTYVPAGPPK